MKYKKLSVYKKLKQIQEVNFCRTERHEVAVYLNALRRNDRAVIEEYESFGDSPRQLIMNKRDYDKHLLFGFTKTGFNQYGWLERPDFLEREEIGFPHRDNWAVSNHITLGRGLNGKWSYGVSYSHSTGGAGYGLGVWGKIFDNRKDCLKSALNDMLTGLEKDSSKTDRWSVHVYLLQDGQIRIIINKSIKKSETDYHTQFHYDCYCTLTEIDLFLNEVNDPATCKRIRNATKWFIIHPILRAIYSQLKEELKALHQFDLIHDFRDLEQFIYRKLKEYGTTEFTINNSLRFGIGENAYTTTEEVFKAKEKEPIAIMNIFDGNHIVSVDTIVFFLFWLSDRDGKLTISDGNKSKDISFK